MARAKGPFVLGWRTWTLWMIPVVATAYFAWVLLVALNVVKTPTVTLTGWVNGGLLLFGVLLALELLLLMRRKGEEIPEGDAEAEAAETINPYAPPGERRDLLAAEIVATSEQYKGLRVIEVSLPPKSQNRGAVYAKSYVQVAPDMVLRIEDLVADKTDLPQIAA